MSSLKSSYTNLVCWSIQAGFVQLRELIMTLRFMTLALSLAVLAACASHSAPQALGDPTTPRVGWVIMQGPSADSPDEEYVCQSNPRDRCVLRASRAGQKSFSEVHLYFHPIGSSTTYEGTVLMSFFGQGPSPLAVAVDAKGVGNDSVVGAVAERISVVVE